MFNNFYQASVVLGAAFSTEIAKGLTILLALVFGVWLLWQVAKIMMPFGPEGGVADIFNKITSKLVLFVFLLVLVGNWGLVWSYFISPITITGLELANSMLASTGRILTVNSGGGRNQDLMTQLGLNFNDGPNCSAANRLTFNFFDSSGAIFSAANATAQVADMKNLSRSIACNIFNVQKIYGVGAALGVLTMMYSGNDFPPWSGTSYADWAVGTVTALIKTIVAIIIGLIMAALFVVVILIYPLYLVDTVFRLGIITVISPILVAAYFLPMTRSWSTTGIKILVASAASFFFLSVLVGLSLVMMAATLSEAGAILSGTVDSGGKDPSFLINATPFGLASLIFTNVFWMIFLSLTAVAVLSLFLMRKANQLAQEFTGAAVGDMGGALAGMARNAAVFAATTAVTMGAGAAIGAPGMAAKGASAAKGVNAINAGGAMPPSSDGDVLGAGSGPPSGGGDMPGIASGFQPSGGGSGGGVSAGAGPAKSNPFPGYSTSMTSPWNPPPAGQLYGDTPPKPISDDMQNLVAAEMGNAPQSNIPSPDSALATGGSGSGSSAAASVGSAAGGSSPVASGANLGSTAPASSGTNSAQAPAQSSTTGSGAPSSWSPPPQSLATKLASLDDNMERALTGNSSAAPGTGAGLQPNDPRRPPGQEFSGDFLEELKARAEKARAAGQVPPPPPKK
jgi:hypothetical protein